MQVLSTLIAAERELESSDYRDVIAALKEEQLVGEAILPHYQGRIKELEALIAKHGIVTLPDREMRIRLASEAESAATPAPNMRPPRLYGNTGEMGEFVLLLRVPGEAGEEQEVVLSHPIALQEVERYTFRSPGQATAYFCGYTRLTELRADTERLLGDDFDLQAYHDFILAQGLLPPVLLRQAVLQEFIGSRVARREAVSRG